MVGAAGAVVAAPLVYDVDWGELDILLVDLPPGTADLQQELVRLLPLAEALVVVSPQDVAHLDARSSSPCSARRACVCSAGSSMTALACPHCGEPVEVFPTVREERPLWTAGVARLRRSRSTRRWRWQPSTGGRCRRPSRTARP